MFALKTTMKKYFLSFLILLLFSTSFSQTKIKGKVINKETKEPVPFASVAFPGTTEGCVTEFSGDFFIETRNKKRTILVSCMGFITDTVQITPNKFQDITIELKADSYGIEEVIVIAGENPADILIKKVIKNKKENNINKLTSYKYEQYTKMQVDINNFNTDVRNRGIMKDFGVAFAGIDTSAVSGKVYMPLIISETMSDFYYKKFPKHRKEVIKAVNTAGIKNLNASKYTGQMYVPFNFYKNYINVADKEFVSPISGTALMVYDFYLLDSTLIDDSWCYHLSFKPKRKYEYTFKGDLWIADTVFALKKISARMSKTANIDFVSDFYVKKEYKKTNDNFFFPFKEEFFIDFNISKSTTGFFGRKLTIRKNIKLNPEFSKNFFSTTELKEILVNDDAVDFDTTFWNENRPEQLTKKEKNIYNMVDSVKNIPAFRKIENTIYLITTGYIKRKYIEFGPYYKIYSKNAIEGARIRLGTRTSNNFSKKIELSNYFAYGFGDKTLKYGIGTKLKISNKPWTLASLFYSKDLIQLGANLGGAGSDNIFAVSTNNDKLLWIEDYEAGIERDLLKSLTGGLYFNHKIINPTDSMRFISDAGEEINNLKSSEITLKAHFGFNEEYIEGVFNRQTLNSLYPIVEFQYTYGIPNFLESNFEYSKLIIGLKYRTSFGFIGKTKYYIEAGKIWGQVPFPLLKLHEGKEDYFYKMISFNLMNYYEFASDQYVSFFGEHHFNGLFFNRVPFIRRLKLREVIYAKGVWGSLKAENKLLLKFPSSLSDVQKPYIELGLGVENILNVFSINYFRRISHLNKTNIRKNGIMLGINISF